MPARCPRFCERFCELTGGAGSARCPRFRERVLRANLGSRFTCASSARQSNIGVFSARLKPYPTQNHRHGHGCFFCWESLLGMRAQRAIIASEVLPRPLRSGSGFRLRAPAALTPAKRLKLRLIGAWVRSAFFSARLKPCPSTKLCWVDQAATAPHRRVSRGGLVYPGLTLWAKLCRSSGAEWGRFHPTRARRRGRDRLGTGEDARPPATRTGEVAPHRRVGRVPVLFGTAEAVPYPKLSARLLAAAPAGGVY